MKIHLCALALVVLAGCAITPDTDVMPGEIQASSDIQVMVLGSYHMAGSTADVVNIEVDNVLTSQRQAELAAIAASLATFNPTVVATEREGTAPDYLDPVYLEFSEEMLATVANERAQLGYRLAKTAGTDRVYAIDELGGDDEPNYFPFEKLMAHAQATGQAEEIQAMIAEVQQLAADFAARQQDTSIADLLIEMNAGPLSSADFYYRMFALDRGEDQPGAELQAYWFMRNAKIFSKLMQVSEPGDRVVIVYGAGHKHWLEHFVEETPGFVLVDPVPYLQAAQSE